MGDDNMCVPCSREVFTPSPSSVQTVSVKAVGECLPAGSQHASAHEHTLIIIQSIQKKTKLAHKSAT